MQNSKTQYATSAITEAILPPLGGVLQCTSFQYYAVRSIATHDEQEPVSKHDRKSKDGLADLLINGKQLTMEVDTGAVVSVIQKKQ